jgi:two-component system NtrC family sensor kinase
MGSIRLRLVALFILVTTVTLATFGIYAQLQLSRELELGFEELQKHTVGRLAISAPGPLWDLDLPAAQSILIAETLPREVRAIQIFDASNSLFAQVARDTDGKIVTDLSTRPIEGIRVEQNLHRQSPGVVADKLSGEQRALGKVVVFFSRDRINATLRSDKVRRLIEILLVDLVLVVALSFSLQMVFRPIGRLRDALFDLANHASEDVEELPETERNEFGAVIQGFNQTQRKLKQVMARRTQAEAEARAAVLKAEESYAELQSAQQSLVESEKLAGLGGLVAGVAHEINTPVGITLTSASVLQEATQTLQAAMADGAVRKSDILAYMTTATESANLIMSNAERAAHLIQSFKQVAADQTSEIRREYKLGEYIDEVMSSLHPKLKKGPTRVSVECPDSIVLDGFPGAMAQVLTNLTMNALAHAFADGQPGEIHITAAHADDTKESVILTFKDNGGGISEDNLGRIFDPFFTTRRGQGGTGLGLNIVHNILGKQFGGSIKVSSKLGEGVCFVMRFPRVSP